MELCEPTRRVVGEAVPLRREDTNDLGECAERRVFKIVVRLAVLLVATAKALLSRLYIAGH